MPHGNPRYLFIGLSPGKGTVQNLVHAAINILRRSGFVNACKPAQCALINMRFVTVINDEVTGPGQSSERVARGRNTSPLSLAANQGRRLAASVDRMATRRRAVPESWG